MWQYSILLYNVHIQFSVIAVNRSTKIRQSLASKTLRMLYFEDNAQA